MKFDAFQRNGPLALVLPPLVIVGDDFVWIHHVTKRVGL